MSSEQHILNFLKAKQKHLDLGTMAFARLLGVSPSLWIITRDGKRPLGVRLAVGASKAFQELEPQVLIFLRYELPLRNPHFIPSKTEVAVG